MPWSRVLVVTLTLLAVGPLRAAKVEPMPVSVAAASNLVHALGALNSEFKKIEPKAVVTTTSGASGGLFAQIRNGAPFDVFLSADTDYPRQLADTGFGDPLTLRTFATGRLVVWTMQPQLDLNDIAALVKNRAVKRIAIAQPKTAPYGRAAQAALEKLGVWPDAVPKLAYAESIVQTAQFVETGNADVGLVAMSLVLSPTLARQGRWKEVPAEWYRSVSLDHAAILTKRGAVNPAARRYLDFLSSDVAKKVLHDFGYASVSTK